MIRIYDGKETNYPHNGLATLTTYKAEIYENENDDFYAKLEFSDQDAQYIMQDNIISLPNANGGYELFRIKNPNVRNGHIYVENAPHIFYDLDNIFIEKTETRDKVKNIVETWTKKTDGRFTFIVDTTVEVYISVENVFLCEALKILCTNAGVRMVRKGFTVTIQDDVAIENGKEIRYGNNLTTFSKSENWDDVCTKVYATGYNDVRYSGGFISLSEGEVTYAREYAKYVKFQPVNDDTTNEIKGAYDDYTKLYKSYQEEIDKYKDYSKQLDSKKKEIQKLEKKIAVVKEKYNSATSSSKKEVYETRLEELNEDLATAKDEREELKHEKELSKNLRGEYLKSANHYLEIYNEAIDADIRAQATQYLVNNRNPSISYSIGVYDEDKRRYEIGENCKLYYPVLGIEEVFSVKGYVYDVFLDEFTSLTFGDKKKTGKLAFKQNNKKSWDEMQLWKSYLEADLLYSDPPEDDLEYALVLTTTSLTGESNGLNIYPFSSLNADKVSIDWGDGIAESFDNVSSGQAVNHTYEQSGQYTIRVTFENLTSITIGTRFEKIMGELTGVENLTSLHQFIFSSCDTCKEVGKNIFINCINVKDYSYAFSNAVHITDPPNTPESVENMNYAFEYCSSLTEPPQIPEGVIEADGILQYCTSMKAIPNIPKTLTRLYGMCLGWTQLIEAPAIPEHVKDIGGMFNNCTSLVKAPIIPEGVENMNGIFKNCSSLVEAPAIPNGVKNINEAFMNCTLLAYAPFLPDSIEQMRGAFSYCLALKTLENIPKFAKDIACAFAGCSELLNGDDIPESVNDASQLYERCKKMTGTITVRATMQYGYYKTFYMAGEEAATPIVLNYTSNCKRIDMLVSQSDGVIKGKLVS